ncbi:SIS domain-containing protein [Terriglobus sp. 2YAB30_2]|uniref:KpsF/GutQ family sugar-phosphate isomerase n=1 Tax=Terriglobus sp. 2YAB30_2 TaxID=3233023 RepID=UPI003F9539D7
METANSITPSDLVRIEAAALESLASRLDGSMHQAFHDAATRLAACANNRQRVVVTGMGKSGLIAQKIAATLNSTGTPAQFLHPAEAIHGDLGMLTRGDLVLALSYSGQTEEILRLLELLKRLGDALITMTGEPQSTLAQASDVVLDCSVSREACTLNLAPTASTTVMLALGDALAIEVARQRGFRSEDFAQLHPGGKLGKRLRLVSQLMHAGDNIPIVAPSTPMPEVIHEMSRKRLGITTVAEDGRLLGIISDGDLRRLLEREQAQALSRTAVEVMNTAPQTIAPDALASSALAVMEERKITSLVVVTKDSHLQGVLHLHDLWGLELV